MTNLAGRTALVTGAAKRLGRELSIAMAGNGADVVLHYSTSGREAETLKNEITAMGRKAWTIGERFVNRSSADELLKRAGEAAGNIDILVNSASIYPKAFESSITGESAENILTVNTWIPWMLSKRFSENADSGDIINILDTRISGHDIGRPVYYISKQMLRYVTEELALSLAPRFKVNAVAPGLILPPEGRDSTYFDKLKNDVPMKKGGTPKEVADAVLYLLRSDFITGQIIYVDGGQHMLHRVYGAV